MGVATQSFLQNAGAVAFWVMVWCCLQQGVKPTRQPLFSRLSGVLMALGLIGVAVAFVVEEAALAAMGRNLCYLAVAFYLWREVVFVRYKLRRARERLRLLPKGGPDRKAPPWTRK